MNILIKNDVNLTYSHDNKGTLEAQAIAMKVRLLSVLIARGIKLKETEVLTCTIKRCVVNKNRIQIKFGFDRISGFIHLIHSVSFLPHKDKFRLCRRMFTCEQLAGLCIRGFENMTKVFDDVVAQQSQKN